MMILITGGACCGKSSLAESLLEASEDKVYIATMLPYGEEALAAIKRHRNLRAGSGYETIEKYTDIDELEIGKRAALLECMGNLLANEMFRDGPYEDIAGHILSGIKKLMRTSEKLVIVTNDVFRDGTGQYTRSTREYIRLLGLINRELACMADTVIECVYGIPVVISKKEKKVLEVLREQPLK